MADPRDDDEPPVTGESDSSDVAGEDVEQKAIDLPIEENDFNSQPG